MGQCDQKYSRGRGEERVKLSSRTASNLLSAHTLQRSTTVPQPATSNTTSKYTPYAVTRGLFS